MKKFTFIQQNNHFMNLYRVMVVALVLGCTGLLRAQCNPDILAPIILCPASTTVNVAPGICSTLVSLPAPTVSDNCPSAVTVTSNAPAGSMYPSGVTVVAFTATDAAGNTATCQSTVTVTGGAVYSLACNSETMVSLNPSGTATLFPEDILEGGPYNCINTSISLQGGSPLPSLTLTSAGTFTVSCWGELPGGGYNQCWGIVIVNGGTPCLPDITQPVAICDGTLVLQTNISGPNTTNLQAVLLDDGSYDNCTASLDFRATTDLVGTQPPTTTEVALTGLGEIFVKLWVGDASGNWNACITSVSMIPPKCNPDVVPPTCIAPANLTLSSEYYESLNVNVTDSLQLISLFGAPYIWDNCANGNMPIFSTYSLLVYSNGDIKEITRTFLTFDGAGNTTVSSQKIFVEPSAATMHIPGWFFPGDTLIDEVEVVSSNSTPLAFSYSDVVYTAPCNGEKMRIERQITVIDWLLYDPASPEFEMPLLDRDGDGQVGDPYDVVFVGDSIWLIENGVLVYPIAQKHGLYRYLQVIRYNYLDSATQWVAGRVYLDSDTDCSYDTGEQTLAEWKVKVVDQNSGNVYTGFTDAAGVYEIFICPGDTLLEISLDAAYVYNTICPMTYNEVLLSGQSVMQDISVMLNDTCPLLSVDLATQRIRPCFPGTYKVEYCNLSTQPVQNVHIEVVLDSFLNYVGASLPATTLGNNTYDIIVGTLAPGFCGMIDVSFVANCLAPVGLTHCSEAHIFPDTVCGNGFWSGAIIAAKGHCEGNNVRLVLENIGTGAMATPLDFVVVEDLIMYTSDQYKLNPGETKEIIMPTTGTTWRIESPQEPGYPWQGVVSAFVEGCGGMNQMGIPLTFSVATSNPFMATDCLESVSSFDPNDKQAIPEGYGNAHWIEKNTDIQYTIRFQNTGSDTAYTVVVIDTLSALLQPSTLSRSVSSHAYDLDILEGNILRIRFDSINLLPKVVNEAGSQGFVKFNISQVPENPNGSEILNHAAIYFDNNAPIVTNTTTHTIGENFIAVHTNEASKASLRTYPNPAVDQVFFELPTAINNGTFILTDALGKTVRQESFNGNVYRFERLKMASGIYYFHIQTSENLPFTGKIMLK